MSQPLILLIDDEKNIRRTLNLILSGEGYEVREAESGDEALGQPLDRVNLVLLDVRMPGRDGLAILPELLRQRPGLPIIMISGHASVSLAVEATRAGAFDFLEKPLSRDRVLVAVRNALALQRLDRTVVALEQQLERRRTLIGRHESVEAVRRLIAKAAPSNATILITGESGTGKELAAQALHAASPRASRAFIKVNCAAIPEDLIESELFGSVRGAFTGADRTRDGRFLMADGGTLFLDEIGDMSLKVQAKVLRALQEGEIERVGDTVTHRVDVRVIAATNKDLMVEAAQGRFREDLFYRLNVLPIRLPSLRERMEDLPLLVHHFLALQAESSGGVPRRISPDALRILGTLPWRGNVRELKNSIERLTILAEGVEIASEDLRLAGIAAGAAGHLDATPGREAGSGPHPGARGAEVRGIPSIAELREQGGLLGARQRFERECIEACLDATDGNVSEAARWLGLERSNLHKKMQALGIEARPSRPSRRGEDDR
ncbi:MAG: sigma-54-dependent Fis family transcriptional regulator [Candidatus Eisenbacteria bacterium]|nr:sigma-54-dependent Fis family transcriptional regulator [Candidatus Eisenbacteria bacterium]